MVNGMTRFRRLQFLIAFLGVISLVVSACGTPGSNTSGGGGNSTITVGVVVPLTGQAAASGKDMQNGWNLYWQLNGNKICNGKTTVKSIVEDTAGSPDTARNKTRSLVEQQGAQMIVGPLFANEGYAVAQYTESKNIPLFSPVASSDDLTQRTANPLFIRTGGWTSSQTSHAYADYMLSHFPQYKNWVTFGPDYAFGYENVGGFVDVLTTGGGKVIKQLWAPLNTTDFSSYLTQIQAAHPDAVFANEVGADAPRFIKAWSDYGLKDKIPLFGDDTIVDQSLLRSMGPAGAGIVSVGHFAEGRDDPATKNFVTAFDNAYHLLPSYYAAGTYTTAQWLAQSFEKVNCNLSNQSAFLNAVKSTELADSPFGPEKLDQYGNPIFNVYIRKVEQRPDGRSWNVVTDTIPNVSQFGKVDPATYLQQPVYSKTFQGKNYHP
jgi:branched-chain amino acid transport system substrate-binding protein